MSMKPHQKTATLNPAYHAASLQHKDTLYPPALKVLSPETSYEADLLKV